MTCASRQRRPSGAPCRNQRKTSRSSSYTPYLRLPSLPRPRVLARRVQRRPGQVEPDAAPGRRERLGLQPGEDPQALRVALEAAGGPRHLVERRLAGVPERRVAEVVREAGRLDQVGVAAERLAELAADLRALQRVGQPGAREVALPRHDDLGLRGEPAQRRGVQHPRAVALVRRAARPLGRLLDPALLAPALARRHGLIPRSEPRVGAAAEHLVVEVGDRLAGDVADLGRRAAAPPAPAGSATSPRRCPGRWPSPGCAARATGR